jgi:hypothetical protein
MEDHLEMAKKIVLFNRQGLWPRLIQRYHQEKRIVDKSHVLLWEVEKLAKEFPDAVFVAIKRNEQATVQSMLKHPGVRAWCADFKRMKIPFPSKMLGCNSGAEYQGMTLQQRCALRWRVHMDEIDRLEQVLPKDRWLTVDYKSLQEYGPILTEFLGCSSETPVRIEKRRPRH